MDKDKALIVSRLQADPTEENLWQALIAFQNHTFLTATGLPFSYTIKRGRKGELTHELLVDRRENSKSLSWSSVKLAFSKALEAEGPITRPKALGDIRGISYIYPLLWNFGLIEVPDAISDKMKDNSNLFM